MNKQNQIIIKSVLPPIFPENAEKTRVAALLNIMLLTLSAAMIFMMAGNLLGGNYRAMQMIILLVLFFLLIGLQFLMRYGMVRQASLIVVTLITISVSAYVYYNGTVRLPAGSVFYVLSSVMAGLLISRRAALISAAVNCVVFLALLIAELKGLLPPPDFSVTISQAVAFTVGSVITVILLNLATHSITESQNTTARVNLALQRSLKELNALNAVAQVGASAKSEDEMLEAVVDTLHQSLYTEIIGVALWDESDNLLRTHPSAHRGLPESINMLTARLHEGIIGEVAASHKPYLLRDINDPKYVALSPELCSELCVPILAGDKLIGVLNVESKQCDAFSDDDEKLLFTIAGQLASALERLRAEQQLRRLNAELEQRVVERTAQLEAANKELESFSYSISHDLRAPIRSISGFSKILYDDFSAGMEPEALGFLRKIITSGEKMSRLIDGLLDFSRLGRKSLKKQEVDLNEIVNNAIETYPQVIPGHQIIWDCSNLPPVCADPALIQQVFVNLIGNAVKYSSKCAVARIEIGSFMKDLERVYFVRDNGAGFDMQFAGKLFGVFQRLHRDDEFEGTGIGLATVRRIVERHGGQIWAEAEPDKGATFFFKLE
jgi:K+-sensing histidine kinase KdpD